MLYDRKSAKLINLIYASAFCF